MLDDFDDPAQESVVFDMSNENYHAHPAISKSGLDLIAKSPAHFKMQARKDTPAFAKGTLAHCAILEPWALEARYFFAPTRPNLKTKTGNAMLAEYQEIAGDRIVTWLDDAKMAIGMRDSVIHHRLASNLLDGGVSEASVFSSLGGVDVRCRPDYWNGSIMVDIKTTENARDFAYSVRKYRYYVQHPFYIDVARAAGENVDRFVFLVIEKEPPYALMIYELDDEDVAFGRREYGRNLDTYKRCLDTGLWPGYHDSIEQISGVTRYLNEPTE